MFLRKISICFAFCNLVPFTIKKKMFLGNLKITFFRKIKLNFSEKSVFTHAIILNDSATNFEKLDFLSEQFC